MPEKARLPTSVQLPGGASKTSALSAPCPTKDKVGRNSSTPSSCANPRCETPLNSRRPRASIECTSSHDLDTRAGSQGRLSQVRPLWLCLCLCLSVSLMRARIHTPTSKLRQDTQTHTHTHTHTHRYAQNPLRPRRDSIGQTTGAPHADRCGHSGDMSPGGSAKSSSGSVGGGRCGMTKTWWGQTRAHTPSHAGITCVCK